MSDVLVRIFQMVYVKVATKVLIIPFQILTDPVLFGACRKTFL